MSTELRFHPAATAEAVEASEYLDSERFGFGELFELELDELCERILEYPESGSPLHEYPAEFGVRAHSMSRFRYSLIVATVDGSRVVYAVAHHSRLPGYWKERLRGR